VAAAIAVLVQVGRNPSLSTDPVALSTTNQDGETIFNAERSEVIKAALMAGADRFTQNTSTTDNIVDYRASAYQTENGLDGRYGAGQVNIYNSYHMIAAGEQNSAEDYPVGQGAVGWRGFDFDPSFGVAGGTPETASYYFTSDDDHCRLVAALAWNIKIDGGTCWDFNNRATLYDLNLYLYDISTPADPELVASSTSAGENTENLWVALQKDRDYHIQVEAPSAQGDFGWDYALAWQVIADGDRDGLADCWELEHGLNPDDPADADEDPDADNLSNLEEFQVETDPQDSDTDDDGSCDGTEKEYWMLHFGTWINDYDGDGEANNLLDMDADADGFLDGMEIQYGSDPSDPSDLRSTPYVPATSPVSFAIIGLCLAGLGAFWQKQSY
jgi:hypothetical protein